MKILNETGLLKLRNKKSHEEPKNESFIRKKLKIYETLEEIAPSTYCTDSARDIANWLVNRPKPYRILYDSKYDVWCIADATMQTHKDMAIDMFDTDTKYLYGAARHLEQDIQDLRDSGKYNDGWTDAEIYADEGFDTGTLRGMFFIPNNYNYRDYEESGFYFIETPLRTGTIFTRDYFDSKGFFKDLYNKLDIMDQLKTSLKQLWKDCYKKYGSDAVPYFYDECEEWGYDEDEIEEFLNSSEMMVGLL